MKFLFILDTISRGCFLVQGEQACSWNGTPRGDNRKLESWTKGRAVSIFLRLSLSKLPPLATTPSPPYPPEKPLCRQLVAGYSKGLMELKL
uniref:Uncharacterized protein n=1 Tax=Cucumis sativus TaxID=3659 RepID=A0A0A0KYA7_CUCSA